MMKDTAREIRSFQIDILRAWGIVFLILVHLHPPAVIEQVFNFNVVLLVIVSGVNFAFIYEGSYVKSLPYLRKRSMALLLPTYIFLSIYFIAIFVSSHLWHIPPQPFTSWYITESFLCLRSGGILYSWILAVYLILAITGPLVSRLDFFIKNNFLYFFIIAALFIFHELLVIVFFNQGFWARPFHSYNYLYYIIPYSCLFAVGVRLHKCSVHKIIWSTVALIMLFGILAMKLAQWWGHFVWTGAYKYPPELYYVLYALLASLCLYVLFTSITSFPGPIKQVVIFISRGSLWVYLWHIAALYAIQSRYTHLFFLGKNYMLAWGIIIIWSLTITFFQQKIISSLISNPKMNPKLKNYLKTAFL